MNILHTLYSLFMSAMMGQFSMTRSKFYMYGVTFLHVGVHYFIAVFLEVVTYLYKNLTLEDQNCTVFFITPALDVRCIST